VKVAAWLARSIADAEARGLPQLAPLLETLARSTEALRAADAEFGHPAAEATDVTNAVDAIGAAPRADATQVSEHDDR